VTCPNDGEVTGYPQLDFYDFPQSLYVNAGIVEPKQAPMLSSMSAFLIIIYDYLFVLFVAMKSVQLKHRR
jgi:hypothetical protein